MRFLTEMLRRTVTITEMPDRSAKQARVRGKSPRARLRQDAFSLWA